MILSPDFRFSGFPSYSADFPAFLFTDKYQVRVSPLLVLNLGSSRVHFRVRLSGSKSNLASKFAPTIAGNGFAHTLALGKMGSGPGAFYGP